MGRRKRSGGFRRDRVADGVVGLVVDLAEQGPLLEELGHLVPVWDTPEPLPAVLDLLERCGGQPGAPEHLALFVAYVARLDSAALLEDRLVAEWLAESRERSAAVRALLG